MIKRSTHRLCIAGYAKIVVGLARCPASNAELAARHNVTGPVMRGIMRRLHALKVVRIDSWRRSKQGPQTRVYGFGDAPDVPMPLNLSDGRPSSHIAVTQPPSPPRRELTTFAELIRALGERRSAEEIREITGISHGALCRNLRDLRRVGLVHVASWERRSTASGGAPIRLYQIGIGKNDATRPAPATKAALNARYSAASRSRAAQERLTRAICSNSAVFHMAAAA